MKKKLIIWLLLALVAAGAGVAVWQYPHPKEEKDLQDLLDAPKTEMLMRLYSANRDRTSGKSISGMTFGFEYYKDKGRYLRHIHNDYEDGKSEDIYLRPDGSREARLEYFPPKDDKTPALLRSKASFGADGKTYTAHDFYRQDGSKERSGKLLASGLYEQSYFCLETGKVERIRLFDEKKEFKSESLFNCANGKLRAEILPGKFSSQSLVKVFREDGSKFADLIREYFNLSGTVYADDGKTALFEFKTDSWGPLVKTFDASQKTTQQWLSSYGRLTYTVFDPVSGKKLYEHEWKTDGVNGNIQAVKQYWAQEFAADSENSRLFKVELDDSGKTPQKLFKPLPSDFDLRAAKLEKLPDSEEELSRLRKSMELVQTLAPDGTVTKTELSVPQKGLIHLPGYPNPGKFKVAPELFKLPAHPRLPEFDAKELGPNRVYDYEGSEPPATNVYSGYDYYP